MRGVVSGWLGLIAGGVVMVELALRFWFCSISQDALGELMALFKRGITFYVGGVSGVLFAFFLFLLFFLVYRFEIALNQSCGVSERVGGIFVGGLAARLYLFMEIGCLRCDMARDFER